MGLKSSVSLSNELAAEVGGITQSIGGCSCGDGIIEKGSATCRYREGGHRKDRRWSSWTFGAAYDASEGCARSLEFGKEVDALLDDRVRKWLWCYCLAAGAWYCESTPTQGLNKRLSRCARPTQWPWQGLLEWKRSLSGSKEIRVKVIGNQNRRGVIRETYQGSTKGSRPRALKKGRTARS